MIYKETQYMEFKPKFNEDVVETLVAFANTKGGRVLVGVDDNRKPLKNFTIGKESLQNWINEVKNKTQPQIIPDVELVDYDGVDVVEFRVQEYPVKPVACRGKYYKRVENSNHLLSLTEIADVYLQSMQYSWDAYSAKKHSYSDLDEKKIQKFIDKVNSVGRFSLEGTPKECLVKLKLYGDLTIEDLKTDKYQANARNKMIAEAFYLTGDIEKYGSGFRRIRKELDKYPTMKLRCEEVPNGFLATVRYTQQKTSFKNVGKDVGKDFTKDVGKDVGKDFIKDVGKDVGKDFIKDVGKDVGKDFIKDVGKEIILLLEQNPQMTFPELTKELNVTKRTIERHINKLKKENKITREGGRKEGKWLVMNLC